MIHSIISNKSYNYKINFLCDYRAENKLNNNKI